MEDKASIPIIVSEYSSGSGSRIEYLNNTKNEMEDRRYCKEKLDKFVNYRAYDGGYEISTSSFAGVVRLPSGITMQVSQKVDSDLAEMLAYLQHTEEMEKKVFFDASMPIDLPPGFHFFPLVAFLFVKELKRILKIGIAKRYVEEEGDLKRMRGQIDFVKNEEVNFSDKTRVYCRYSELTYDIPENQVILYCINRLMHRLPSWIKRDSNGLTRLQSELNRYAMDLSEQVSLKRISTSELKRIPRNRLNKHYEFMFQLAGLIISENVYSGFRADAQDKKRVGVSFLVDMNWVFECFVSKLIEELCQDEWIGWKVELQNKSSDLLEKANSKNPPPKIKPDILLKNEKMCIPIDVKYKKYQNVSSSDYYQVISYSLAKKSEKCALVVAEAVDDLNPHFRLHKNITDEFGKRLEISIIGIDLESGQKASEHDRHALRNKVKQTLRDELAPMINRE